MEKSVPRPILPRPRKFAYIFIGASLSRHQVEAKDEKKRAKLAKIAMFSPSAYFIFSRITTADVYFRKIICRPTILT